MSLGKPMADRLSKDKVRTSFAVHVSMKNEIVILAAKEGKTVTDIVTEALENYIENTKKLAMPTKRRRIMVNLPPELERPVIDRARAENRSVANYIENLIAMDVARWMCASGQPTTAKAPAPRQAKK
jgi:hypothetical protein